MYFKRLTLGHGDSGHSSRRRSQGSSHGSWQYWAPQYAGVEAWQYWAPHYAGIRGPMTVVAVQTWKEKLSFRASEIFLKW